ncbi:MAG: MarR family transcriptional regulator [Nocardioidaceae bacterium]
MDAGELHRLGRRLLALSRATSGEAGDLALVPGQEAVLEDLLRHPDSTVSEIRDRTGFTQSHVSASVARLRDHHLIRAASDPNDGRRTRLRATEAATQAIANRAGRSIDATIATAVVRPNQAEHVLGLLDELSQALQTQPPESNIS